MNTYRYDTIFLYASLQSVGHTIEYFSKHTRKLIVFIIMPRVNGLPNLLREYRDGVLVSEIPVPSSTNIFLYYLLWFWYHHVFIYTRISMKDRAFVLAGHPIAFFTMDIVRVVKKVTFAYWIGDYFPPVHWSLRAFEWVKRKIHDRVPITYYLSDTLNKTYNGSLMRAASHRTVMWGVAAGASSGSAMPKAFTILFVGVIRPSQGIETILSYVRDHADVRISILGSCEVAFYAHLKDLIKKYGIAKRVSFPNRFVSDDELVSLASSHHVGIALYEKGAHTATHYTDPGKVKTYIELDLPVIMTDTSAIAPFIRRFGAGIVIENELELPSAFDRMKRSYASYQKGLKRFAAHFSYEKYYAQAFKALERGKNV